MQIHHLFNDDPVGIIFIPGFLSDIQEFKNIAQQLDTHYSVFIADLFTDYPHEQEVVYSDFLALLQEQIRALPIQKKILVGYSLGARLALGCYLQNPEEYSGLFLESLNPGIHSITERKNRAEQDEELAAGISPEGWKSFLQGWYQNPIFALNQQELDQIVEQKYQADPLKIAKILKELSVGKMPSYWEELDLIKCPVTLLAGSLDLKFSALAKKVQSEIAHAKLKLLTAGHNMHCQQSKEYLLLLQQFLVELRSDRS